MLYKKLFIFLFLMFTSNLATANDSERHKTVDGMSVYFGIVLAQLIHGHGNMHSATDNRDGDYTYHILIALFDNKSGKRITDAKIKATVTPLGMKGKSRKLEPMHGDLVSYGNYFTMPEATPYRISVEIQRIDKGTISIAEFTFKQARD